MTTLYWCSQQWEWGEWGFPLGSFGFAFFSLHFSSPPGILRRDKQKSSMAGPGPGQSSSALLLVVRVPKAAVGERHLTPSTFHLP